MSLENESCLWQLKIQIGSIAALKIVENETALILIQSVLDLLILSKIEEICLLRISVLDIFWIKRNNALNSFFFFWLWFLSSEIFSFESLKDLINEFSLIFSELFEISDFFENSVKFISELLAKIIESLK